MLGERLALALVVVAGVPAAMIAYVWLVERSLTLLPHRRRPRLRPWLWAGPALALLTTYLIYPTLHTAYLSLRSADSERFVGLENYAYIFTNSAKISSPGIASASTFARENSTRAQPSASTSTNRRRARAGRPHRPAHRSER